MIKKDEYVTLSVRRLGLLIWFFYCCSNRSIVDYLDACERVYFGNAEQKNIACKCNSTIEDSLTFDWPTEDDVYIRVFSGKSGARFRVDKLPKVATNDDEQQVLETSNNNNTSKEVDYVVNIQTNKRLQQVVGFGGSFTDSAAICLMNLPENLKKKALDDYFGPNGLDYSIGRIPIAGTDMSTRAYSYDDLPPGINEDFDLKYFKLQPEDLLYKIPLINRVNLMRKQRDVSLEPLKLIAASWSAPAWMKSNNNLVQGHLKVDPSYYDAYARYIVRFLNEYEQNNISMWAISPQNEPFTPKRVGPIKINFNSVNFNPKQIKDYLEFSLIPKLKESGRTADRLKLFIWDDTLDDLYNYQQAMLSSKIIRDYTSGLAIHWYSQGLKEISYRHLHNARRNLPARYALLSTEASFIGKPQPGNWDRGERYARDIIENLRAGSIGWIDWNLALDMSGGPTWSDNNLDSAISVDHKSNVYYKNPMYYALGHVSRFIKPGSYIVVSTITPKGSSIPSLTGLRQDEIVFVASELAAFAAEDKLMKFETPIQLKGGETKASRRKFSIVALNRSPNERRVRFHLSDCPAKTNQSDLVLDLEANSMTSLAFIC